MIEIHKEIVPGAPFPLRQQTASELEKLARTNPPAAAHQRIAGDLSTALKILSRHYDTLESVIENESFDGNIDLA